MDFKTAARISTYISKDYAYPFFTLLVNYQNLSASEAASRLGLHIRTAQDFMEGLTELGLLSREEVYEKKRPYYRYTLETPRILIDVDLSSIAIQRSQHDLDMKIREKTRSGANFSLSRNGKMISFVTLWSGGSRDRKEQKISLTDLQGTFLYHLPFPNAKPLTIMDIMIKAGLDTDLAPEILDIVKLLIEYEVIEEF